MTSANKTNHHLWAIAVLAILFTASPSCATTSVRGDPDQERLDATGAILVTANLFTAGFIADGLGDENASNLPKYFGLGLGAGSLAVAYADETSFSYLVVATGVVTLALSVAGLVTTTNNDASDSFDLSRARKTTISPLVLGDSHTGYRAGLLFVRHFEERSMTIGTVKSLHSYPVKSFQGETRTELDFDFRGAQGDRLYAIITAAGKFGSGKNTRRFQKIDNLFGFKAHYSNGEPQITFPDGKIFAGDHPKLNEYLSNSLKQPVSLEREKEVPHFDGSPIHIVTTSSLNWLADKLPGSAIDACRFRPNLVLETEEPGLVEQTWLGKTIRLGSVAFEITSGTIRCLMTTLPQAALPRDPKILKCIAGQLDTVFGVYAKVIQGGVVRTNDIVSMITTE